MRIAFKSYDKIIPLSKLKPNKFQRNKHPKDQIERLAKIMREHGVRHPIHISKRSGQVCFGHGRWEAAKLNKWDKFPVVYQDFKNEKEEFACVQSDNAIASWAELDLKGLKEDLADFQDLDIDLLGLEDFEISEAKEGKIEDDEIPDVKKTRCKRGDVWQLGRHRLMCGDSTMITDVEKLMGPEPIEFIYTDPPYGISLEVDYVKRYGKKESNDYKNKIAGDYGPDAGVEWQHLIALCDEVFVWGADNYPDFLPRGGSWVVWDKSVEAVDGIASDFELCWSKKRHHYSIMRKLWKGAKAREETGQEGAHRTRWGHPTQKPIELAVWFFEKWANKKKNVFDAFGGSGTTLIACEKTNRRCFMMEIDPHYCDVILARWEKYTGQKAELVNEKPKSKTKKKI